MISNPNFWYAVAFVIFFLLLGRVLWRLSTQMLEEKIKHIRHNLEDAARMKEEADDLLAMAHQKQKEAQDQAHEILALSEREIKRIQQDALKEQREFLTNQERQLEERLASLEILAFKEVNESVTRTAVDIAKKIIEDNLDKKLDSTLIQKTIQTAQTIHIPSLENPQKS